MHDDHHSGLRSVCGARSLHPFVTGEPAKEPRGLTDIQNHLSFNLNSLLFKFIKHEVERTLEGPAMRCVPALNHHQSGPVASVRDLVLNTPETVSPEVVPRTPCFWGPFLTLVSRLSCLRRIPRSSSSAFQLPSNVRALTVNPQHLTF